jgi:anti-sigma factor RsiW
MSRLGCAEILPHLESYRQGDASSELAVLVDDHLGRCPECRRRLAHLKQVSAMLSAWRPRRVPGELKVEVAEAVSEELAAEARQMFAAGRRPARLRRRGPKSRLTPTQRVANALALAALVFLAGVIVYRSWHADTAATEGRYVVRLARLGPAGEDAVAQAERLRRALPLVEQAAGLDAEEAAALLKRLPATLTRVDSLKQAEDIAQGLRRIGGRVEIVDSRQTSEEPRKAPGEGDGGT